MKILVVGHAYLAPINRKKWDVYANIFPEDEVVVVTPSFWNDALFDVALVESNTATTRVTYKHVPVSRPGNEVLYRYAWTDVWQIMNECDPDLLLVEQGLSAFSYFQFILVSLLQGRRIPRVFFTWINWRHRWGWLFRFLWWPLEWFNWYFSSAAIVGNPQAEKLLREDGFKAPVLVSPQLGVDLVPVVPRSAEHKNKRVGFVGRLTSEKGIFTLLHAFAQLQHEDWELVFVGSGPQQKALQIEAERCGISLQVVFTGSVDHERALELINSFEILVLPSLDIATWREQFGHVIIEAMAAGVVVIGSDAGAIPWVIGDAGLIFRQNCIEELRDVLSRVLHSDAERLKYAQRGLHRVTERYTHESVARAIGKFLHERTRTPGILS